VQANLIEMPGPADEDDSNTVSEEVPQETEQQPETEK
jgi:hypothetical protein